MFVISHAVVSVFAVTVLLNVFYIDPTQSKETFNTCEECIKSTCHKEEKQTCVLGSSNDTYFCLTCNKNSPEGDFQFYSKADCIAWCDDKTQCLCSDVCYVCAQAVDPEFVSCEMPSTMVDDDCNEVPYVPQNG